MDIFIKNIRRSLKGILVEENETTQIVLTEKDAVFTQIRDALNDAIKMVVTIDGFTVNTTSPITANLRGSLNSNLTFTFDLGNGNDGVTIETHNGGFKLTNENTIVFQKLNATFDTFSDEIKKTYLSNT